MNFKAADCLYILSEPIQIYQLSMIVQFHDSINESKAINLLLDNNEVFLMVGHSMYNMTFSQILMLDKLDFEIVNPLTVKLYNSDRYI